LNASPWHTKDFEPNFTPQFQKKRLFFYFTENFPQPTRMGVIFPVSFVPVDWFLCHLMIKSLMIGKENSQSFCDDRDQERFLGKTTITTTFINKTVISRCVKVLLINIYSGGEKINRKCCFFVDMVNFLNSQSYLPKGESRVIRKP